MPEGFEFMGEASKRVEAWPDWKKEFAGIAHRGEGVEDVKLARCPGCSEIYHSRDMEIKSPVHFKKTCRKCGHVEDKIADLEQKIDRLESENFGLAAKQCIVENGLLGDDHGHQYCDMARQVATLQHELAICMDALREIAAIAHHGALVGYQDPLDALSELRKLSLPWWDNTVCNELQKRLPR